VFLLAIQRGLSLRVLEAHASRPFEVYFGRAGREMKDYRGEVLGRAVRLGDLIERNRVLVEVV